MSKDSDDLGCLILLCCIFFPEIIPFVIVYYLIRLSERDSKNE